MLAVAGFIAFWVLVAFGLFFVAARGGLGGARATIQKQSRGTNRLVGVSFTFIAIAFGVGLPLAMLIGNHDNASAQIGGLKLNAADKRGRELFGVHCAVCHTLAAANAVGKVGPNLDILKPAQSVILNTINNGCLPNASSSSNEGCLGQGVMPSGVVQGQDAQNVAAFVAKVAGNE